MAEATKKAIAAWGRQRSPVGLDSLGLDSDWVCPQLRPGLHFFSVALADCGCFFGSDGLAGPIDVGDLLLLVDIHGRYPLGSC